jgi:tetrapyrrole methylase family protein/MazG family protein
MSLTIIGLGPGAVDDLSLRAWRTLEHAATVFLRTERHPCVPHLPQSATYESFDTLYENAATFDDVYSEITSRLLERAKNEPVVYAVPGDPLVGESTATRLLDAAQSAGIDVQIINGISFIEPMLSHLGVDALDGLQIFDALEIAARYHPPLNPAFPALLAQVYSRQVASDVKLTLMNQYPDEFEVMLIHGAGTDDATIERVPLYEIDRSDDIAHLTSLYVPACGEYTSFESFQDVIAHLRSPQGCPWDRKQTHESLRPYLIEEAYEVLEAIDNEDRDALPGELGDLLLQIVLHTQIATEYGDFYMTDVLDTVNRKMVRRHPHVWGDVDVAGDAEKVVTNWDAIKQQEKAARGDEKASLLGDIAPGPSLWVAHKYQHKAAKVGFDWPDVSGVEDKVREELDEIFAEDNPQKKADEIADLMFVLVNWLRWLGVDDPESQMRAVNAKFARRFHYIEQHAQKPLDEMTLDEMDALWNEAKAGETGDS